MKVEWKHVAEPGKTVTREAVDLVAILAGPSGALVIVEDNEGYFHEARLADLRCLDRLESPDTGHAPH